MKIKHLWLKRMALGGVCAVGGVLMLILLLNFIVNSISILGSTPDYTDIQLTFDRCAYHFGSAALAVAVEFVCVFALGAAIGIATLPFAETWTSMLGLSLLHFVITGGLALLVGWSYGWFGMGPAGPRIVTVLYLVIYLLIWLIRWMVWYNEVRQMRKALGLKKEVSSNESTNHFADH